MMQITHAVSGAAVGAYAPNPYVAFLLGIIIHFFVDGIFHYWPKAQKTKNGILVVDYFLTVIFIFWLYLSNFLTANVVAAISASLIIDILLVGVAIFRKSKIGEWHHNRQDHKADPKVFVTDIAVIGLSLLLIILSSRVG